ncbi:uncharacterized protein PHACADRAFT_28237 [Phanerochaete carnosa HHB-10118-sp]|uniref:Uncharacterized protein n=1 Tax=Phanerochaete carnosa (strain HHB-10118-sp) TaxID=650164 RepID=K5WXF7_PHACS|nr:uncharacterized protein PHACADRAFT_28237 [Phanerochaete carnosa HHB-10118-sp]EKM55172.1 hypothetical protein PHACADRAFT_28237 [Phanerochaete carnosa HHB-10118-sp]
MDRSIVFNWHGISRRQRILLCFAPPGDKIELGAEQNHIVWKIIDAEGYGSASVFFTGRLACGQTALCPEGRVRGSHWVNVERGESVALSDPDDNKDNKENKSGPGEWTKASVRNIDDPCMHIHNGTSQPQTFVLGCTWGAAGTVRSIGFYQIRLFEPTFCWKAVRPKQTVNAKFDPHLCAAILDGDKLYEESEMLTARIPPECVFWRQNVNKLPAVSYFEFMATEEGFVMRREE